MGFGDIDSLVKVADKRVWLTEEFDGSMLTPHILEMNYTFWFLMESHLLQAVFLQYMSYVIQRSVGSCLAIYIYRFIPKLPYCIMELFLK